MSKPKFDPSQPFQAVKPKFDPSQPYDSEQTKTAEDVPTEEPGYIESALRGGAQGATFGTADEIAAALTSPTGAFKKIANILGANTRGEDLDKYQKELEESRAAYKAAEEANPLTSFAGNIAGGLVPSAAAIMLSGGTAAPAIAAGAGKAAGAAKGLQALSNVQKAALVGGLEGAGYGLGQSEEESLGGIAKDIGTGGVLGTAMGGVAGKLGRYLGGNISEIERGALPKSTIQQKGALTELGESKLGQRLKGFYEAGKKGIDITSSEAEKTRGKINLEEAAKMIEESTAKQKEVGKAIGEKIKESGPFNPESLEQILPQISQKEIPEEITKTIPGKVSQVSAAPENIIKELDATENEIKNIIGKDSDQVVRSFQKTSNDLIDPAAIEAELPYSKLSSELSDKIKKAAQQNPDSLIEDVISHVAGQEQSPELLEFTKAIKLRSQINKLTKEAQVNGIIPENIQNLQSLLDKRSALKKTISLAGKTSITEPDVIIKNIETRLSDAHIDPDLRSHAEKLRNVINRYMPDGNVKPEKSLEFRNSLNDLANKADTPYEISQMAKTLRDEIATFRKQAAGGLSEEFHDIKSFGKMLKVDTANKSDNEIQNEVASKFASFIEKSNEASLSSGRKEDLLNKFLEANDNNPRIVENLNKIKENVKWSELYNVKSGSKGSMLNDGINRLLFAFPAETSGQMSNSALIQNTKSVGQKMLMLPSDAWRSVGKKLESISPKTSRLAMEMAESTDEGKKRAIINTLNQMPQFRNAIQSMSGLDEEE
jgi:hypothetical protein